VEADDRLAVALWGLTGTLKTTFAKHCMAMYGTEYESDRYLINQVAALTLLSFGDVFCRNLAGDSRQRQKR